MIGFYILFRKKEYSKYKWKSHLRKFEFLDLSRKQPSMFKKKKF